MAMYTAQLRVPSGTNPIAVRECVADFVRNNSFGRHLPDEFLMRTVLAMGNNPILSNLPRFFSVLAAVGHDRNNNGSYGHGISAERQTQLWSLGYDGDCVIWANRSSRHDVLPFMPHHRFPYSGVLFLDPKKYCKIFSNIYVQQRRQLRRDALLGFLYLEHDTSRA